MILQTGLTPTPEDEEDHDRHRPADGQKRDPQGLEPLGEGSLEPSVLEDLEASGFVPSPPPNSERRNRALLCRLPSRKLGPEAMWSAARSTTATSSRSRGALSKLRLSPGKPGNHKLRVCMVERPVLGRRNLVCSGLPACPSQ